MKISWLFIFLFLVLELHSFEFRKLTQNQRLLIAPEVYFTKRTRKGGTEQTGWLYGIHLNYDRIKPQGLYWGFDGYYATGDLSGKNAAGMRLKSAFTDGEAEGRLGWTFNFLLKKPILFTPYVSYGYIFNENQFDDFSVTFEDDIQYYGAGFLATLCYSPNLTFGMNLGFHSMFEGISRLKEAIDPQDQGAELMMENKNFYTIEFPISWKFHQFRRHVQAWITPFYRYRFFGGRENFPQDFIETKYRFYGLRAGLCCCY